MGRPVLQLVLLKQYFSCVKGDERERTREGNIHNLLQLIINSFGQTFVGAIKQFNKTKRSFPCRCKATPLEGYT